MKRPFGKLWKRVGPWLGAGRGPVILLYHRVVDLPTDPQLLAVRPEHFAEHLEILRQYTTPLSLAELTDRVAAGTAPANAVAVTFDDGYFDNLEFAKPLLARYGVPATVFVATANIGRQQEFWWDELERLLLLPGELPARLELQRSSGLQSWDLGGTQNYTDDDFRRHRAWNVVNAADPTRRHGLYRELCPLIRTLTRSERETVLQQIRLAASCDGSGRVTHRCLSRLELIRLATDGLVEIGAHTVHHPVLSSLGTTSQQEEITRSKAELENMLQQPVDSFSYPFGTGHDYDNESMRIVRRAGFRRACANQEGTLSRRGDVFQLPRFLVRDWGGETFARKLEEWSGARLATTRLAG